MSLRRAAHRRKVSHPSPSSPFADRRERRAVGLHRRLQLKRRVRLQRSREEWSPFSCIRENIRRRGRIERPYKPCPRLQGVSVAIRYQEQELQTPPEISGGIDGIPLLPPMLLPRSQISLRPQVRPFGHLPGLESDVSPCFAQRNHCRIGLILNIYITLPGLRNEAQTRID